MNNCSNADSFTFNGIDCRTLGLMMCQFSSSSRNDQQETGLTTEVKTDDFNMIRKEYNQYGVIYKNPITFELGVTKIDATPLTRTESHSINKWLSTDTYKIFRFNDENPENIIYKAICTDIKDIYMGSLVGKSLKFETSSPFGYSRKQSLDITGTFQGVSQKFTNESDDGIYYPTIYIDVAEGYSNTVIIENVEEKKSITIDFSQLSDYSLILDSKRTRVTNADGKLIPSYKLGWDGDYSSLVSDPDIIEINELYFPRMLEGENTFLVTGECNVQIVAEFPRKVGVLL